MSLVNYMPNKQIKIYANNSSSEANRSRQVVFDKNRIRHLQHFSLMSFWCRKQVQSSLSSFNYEVIGLEGVRNYANLNKTEMIKTRFGL